MHRTRRTGVLLAAVTAVVSGVAVFVNGYGVRAWAGTADATTYTTAKNAVAAIVLIAGGAALRRTRLQDKPRAPADGRQRILVAAIAVIGGSIPFVLFFEGLAVASSTQAAFIHKTLVVWVALLAPIFLGERVRAPHVAAIGLLVAGQLVLAGAFSDVAWGRGETLMLAATLLWSVEVVVAKHVLHRVPSMTVGIGRMAGGAVILIGWGLARGSLGSLLDVGAAQWGWVLVTGFTLAAYVGTWYAALARAQAVDVTAVLVGGALITALLRSGIAAAPLPDPLGAALVAAGVAVAAAAARMRQPA